MVFGFMMFHFAHPRVPHPYQTTLGPYQFHHYVVGASPRLASSPFFNEVPFAATTLGWRRGGTFLLFMWPGVGPQRCACKWAPYLCRTYWAFGSDVDLANCLICLAPRAGFEPATNRLTAVGLPSSSEDKI